MDVIRLLQRNNLGDPPAIIRLCDPPQIKQTKAGVAAKPNVQIVPGTRLVHKVSIEAK